MLELKIPPVAVTLLCAAVMWLVSRLAPVLALPPAFRKAAMVVFLVAGAFVGMAAIVSFRKAKTTVNPLTPQDASSLVSSGIFRFTRNPMYLALLFALVAWGLYLGNLYTLALTVVFVAYMNRFQIKPEERALEAAFGQEFVDYRRRVRRWL